MDMVRTRQTVAMLLHYGFTHAEIACATERSKSTIAYHARNLGRPADERFNRRYGWGEVQRFYDAREPAAAVPQLHSQTDNFAGRDVRRIKDVRA